MILLESDQVEKMARNAYYFHCFKEELGYLKLSDWHIIKKASHMNFYFQQKIYQNFVKKQNFLGSSTSKCFNLFQMKTEGENNVDFLNFSFPKKMTSLYIDSNWLPLWSISNVLESITRISTKVLNRMWIYNFRIDAKQFKRVMVAYKHVKRIHIHCCKLSIPKAIDFSQSLRNTKIKELDFYRSGSPNYSDWRSNPQELAYLI
ncbi:unnamed protein product [Moneuplotes crassus]|uniref:Uncharacterized protein n=1 Tax=Euplotes crassus TaxID=5936 RepID=A0AAD1UAD1_EUPCR|nr:unnamed protein product [Moneuplotes crassus]